MKKNDDSGDINITGPISGGIGNVYGHHSKSNVVINITFAGPTSLQLTQNGLILKVNVNYKSNPTPAFPDDIEAEPADLKRLIGHYIELGFLADLYSHALDTGCGQVVIVTSEQGYGRLALGRSFVDAVRRGAGNAAIGRFWLEETDRLTWRDTRWQVDLERLKDHISTFPNYLRSLNFVPLQAILAQLLRDQVNREGVLTLPSSPNELRDTFRNMTAGKKPAVILLEDFDYAGVEWEQLLDYLQPELCRELPLIFILTLHASRALDQLPPNELSRRQHWALELALNGKAEIYHLSRVSEEEIAQYIYPAVPELAKKMSNLTDGIPMLIEKLWDDLHRQKQVTQNQEGKWELKHGSRYLAYGSSRDMVLDYFDRSWPVDDEPPFSRNEMLDILACAACEGVTFTLDALAYAFDCTPEILELQLDCLLDDPDSPDAPGLLVDAGKQIIDWKLGKLHRELPLYRFQPLIGWHVFSKYFDVKPERIGKFADGLVRSNSPFLDKIAATAWRLYNLAGRSTETEQFRKLMFPVHTYDRLLIQIEILQTMLAELPGLVWRLLDLMYDLAYSGFIEDEPQNAETLFDQMFELAHTVSSKAYEGDSLYFIGRINLIKLNYEKSESCFQHSYRIYVDLGREDGIAATLTSLGHVNRLLGNFAEAEDFYQKALVILRRIGSEFGISVNLNSLGQIAVARGQYVAAEGFYRKALAISKRQGSQVGIAFNLTCLSQVAYSQGQYASAENFTQKALSIFQRLGKENDIASELFNLGNIAFALLKYDSAEDYYLKALIIREGMGMNVAIGSDLSKLGDVAYAKGQLTMAEDFYQKALAIFENKKEAESIAENLTNLGNVANSQKKFVAAKDYFSRAMNIYRKLELSDRIREIQDKLDQIGKLKVDNE